MASAPPAVFANNNGSLYSTSQSPQQIQLLFQLLVIQIFGTAITNPAQPFNTGPWNPPPNGDPVWSAVRVGWQTQGQPAWTINQDVCVIMARPENTFFGQWRDGLLAVDPGYAGSTQDSLTVGLGTVEFEIQTNLSYVSGTPISITYSLDSTVFMQGTVTTYNPANGDMVVAVTAIGGSGTFASWNIALIGLPATVLSEQSYTQVWTVHFVTYGPNSHQRARLIVDGIFQDWANDILEASNLYIIPEYNRPVRNPELFNGQWWERCDVSLQFNEDVEETLVIPAAASVPVTVTSDIGASESIVVEA
jgi:hypothetical protein